MKTYICMLLLLSYISTIGIPLNAMINRCMIAYTDDDY
jgi:hypothetical protein